MTTTPKKPISDSVLQRIEQEAVRPTPRVWFLVSEYGVWILWAGSVLFGALALAVIIMVSVQSRYALYEATHESWVSYIGSVLPYVWLGIFIVMVMVAYTQLRNTKRGYKYPFSHIVGSSIVFSILGGVGLYAIGVGSMLDNEIGKRMPMYMSLEKQELRMWQAPAEGRLVGAVRLPVTANDTLWFTDVSDQEWVLITTELQQLDQRRLTTGERVRLLGIASTTTRQFKICGVFPWLFNKNMGVKEYETERVNFIERMYAHGDAQKRLQDLQSEVGRDHAMGVCAEMAAVRRVSESMR